MANPSYLNLNKPISSPCPTLVLYQVLCRFSVADFILSSSNGRQTVGDGAFYVDVAPSVLAVCHVQGADDMYYYSTAFSGGPGVCHSYFYTSNVSAHVL